MKLISLYIENFGGLSRYSLEFNAGITTVMQPNGFGKTTLAEFIRAMFYGFPRKSKTLGKSRRQKYAPWNGGTFGGNLVFEHGGKCYRVERAFGATPKGDTFTLIDLGTNKKTTRFSEELGQELFGLDADAFERSTYLPQMQEAGPLATASIQAKLTELVEDGEMANFDKAIGALKAKRSAIIPYRGSGGSAAETAGRITELQLRLDDAQTQYEQYLTVQQETARTEAEHKAAQEALLALQQKLTGAMQNMEAAMRQEQYAQLRCRLMQVSERVENLQKAFPAGFPDAQSLRDAARAADRLEILEKQAITTPADRHAQAVLEENSSFGDHLPTADQIARCRSCCEAYETIQSRIRAAEQEDAQKPKSSSVPAIVMLAAGIAAAAAGAWLMLQNRILYGAIAAAGGIAAALTAILILLLQRKKRREESNGSRLVAALRRDADQYGEEIRNLLMPHFGIVEPKYFLPALTQLEHNLQAYTQAQQQLHDWKLRTAHRDAELEKERQQLNAFFARYQMAAGEDIRGQLSRLRDDIHDARALLVQKQELTAELESFRRQYADFLDVTLPSEQELRELKAQERELRAVLECLHSELLQQKQQLQILRAQTECIGHLREELESCRQKLAKAREDVGVLDATMEYLQRARENLSTAYLGTIRSRFTGYLAQLEGIACETCLIDPEFQVQLERSGKMREMACFSAGESDLVMLCMRLALVDALFREQEVFVILDDPFVNLDDARTAQARTLLHTLAAHRQILYLTCHSSRML